MDDVHVDDVKDLEYIAVSGVITTKSYDFMIITLSIIDKFFEHIIWHIS